MTESPGDVGGWWRAARAQGPPREGGGAGSSTRLREWGRCSPAHLPPVVLSGPFHLEYPSLTFPELWALDQLPHTPRRLRPQRGNKRSHPNEDK